MHVPPNAFSSSVIGKARLLMAILQSGDALSAKIGEAENASARLTVWFPNADEQWPTDEDGKRETINPVAVAHGEVKHARLMLDGVKVSRQASIDFLNDAGETATLSRMALKSNPFVGNRGQKFPYETGRMVPSLVQKDDDGKPLRVPEVKFHTHRSLRDDLSSEIKRLGLNPREVLKAHGYRG